MRRWTRSDTQCRRGRAVGEGAVAARKLGGGGHGGSALACARAEGECQEGQERVRDAGAARESAFRAAGSRVARGMEFGHASAMEGALCCMVDASACCRTPGVRRGGRRGEPIWATSRPNQTLGQK